MRIRSLRLLAFGPFSGRELMLQNAGPTDALQIIYGPNEAGKSTALRAIGALLFGFPVTTRDAHVHRMPDLRVGGVLEAADGTVLEVVRRKGNKNTLLDAAGNPIDEAPLRRLCGGATEATFRTLFGLDHVTLREGAEALLAGKGDVGESLFDAALGGGQGIRRVLQAMEAEADALFTPQAQKRKLNEVIRLYQEARTRTRDTARSGEAWVLQTRSLDEAEAERARLREAVRTRRRELSRIERARRLAPLGARRDRLEEERARLGDVAPLGPEAPRARALALQARAQAAADVARLTAEVADATERRSRLSVPQWLDDPAVARLSDLPDRLGAHRKAAEDRPRLCGALAAAVAEAQVMAERIHGSAGPEVAALTVAAQARVRKLALSEAALVQAAGQAAQALAEIESRRAARAEALAALARPCDPRPLRALLRKIDREGDLPARLHEATRDRDRLAGEVARTAGSLGLEARPAAAVLALAVPDGETVQRFADEWHEQAARLGQHEDALGTMATRRGDVERRLAELAGGGDVPTLQALVQARGARAAAWSRLRTTVFDGASPDVIGQAATLVEHAIDRADEAADRLWREADRVARAAALSAERDDLGRAIADATLRLTNLHRQREATAAAWRDTWRPVGIDARTPEERRGWLRRFAALAETARRSLEAEAAVTTLAERLRDVRDEAAAAVAAMTGQPAAGDLPALCDRAAGLLAAADETERRREALATELAALDDEHGRVRRAGLAAAAALAEWRQQWAEALAPLGLSSDAGAAEATAVLDAAATLARKQDEQAQLRRRIDAIDRDARVFIDLVRTLQRAFTGDAAAEGEGDVVEAAERLLVLHRDGQQARRERDVVDAELARRRESLQAAEARHAEAEAVLAALVRAAGVDDLAALERAEQRADEARELSRKRAELDDQILAAADGLALGPALAEARACVADDLDDRASAQKEDLDTLEAELSAVERKIGSLAAGLKLLDESAAEAAAAADEAQSHLARVRGLAEQYARLRLGTLLLAREVERYRERHQGPVLARGSALLARLTQGRYTGLRADFDDADRPVLRCVRADGTRVPVEGLSDGTRDQLYLALRLGTLERQAASAEPLPLVLDDILVHFDDDRAGAALEVLTEHARTTQVVLFTHHARVLDLAGRVAAPGRVNIVRLGDGFDRDAGAA